MIIKHENKSGKEYQVLSVNLMQCIHFGDCFQRSYKALSRNQTFSCLLMQLVSANHFLFFFFIFIFFIYQKIIIIGREGGKKR